MIRDGRVSEIRDGFVDVPSSSRVVDQRARFVLPGLIDSHVHLTSDTGGQLGQQMFDDEVRAIVGTAKLYGKKVAVHAHGGDGIKVALAADVGTLEPGKRADLIAVDGDPLADVAVLKHVPFVMKDGREFRDGPG